MNQRESEIATIVVDVSVVGHNSLIGSLAARLIEDGHIQDIEYLKMKKVVFNVKKILPEIDLYREINNVKNLTPLKEDNISVYFV